MVTRQRATTSQGHEVECHCRRYVDRVAIVTGAAQGMGRVIAQRLAQEGARVLIADVQEERVQRTAKQLQERTGMSFVGFGGDLSAPGVADAMAQRAVESFGRIDTLVNNAGYGVIKPFLDYSEELMQRTVNFNLWTTIRSCRAVLPTMLEQGYGRIVNLGAEAFRTGLLYHTIYGGAAKGGVVGLTTTLGREMATKGITVNCVSPHGTDTELDGSDEPPPRAQDPERHPPDIMRIMSGNGDFEKSQTFREIRMERRAHPTEIAAAVAFMGSPEASFITGQLLSVNGGAALV